MDLGFGIAIAFEFGCYQLAIFSIENTHVLEKIKIIKKR